MSDIQIVKLKDGSTIVGKISIGPEIVEIEHPIELVAHLEQKGGLLGEQISLRPWISISSEKTFSIERTNIITTTPLHERFVKGYNTIVDSTYLNNTIWDDPLLLPETNKDIDSWEELELEDIAELSKAMIKKQIH